MPTPLSLSQEAEAQELAQAIAKAAQTDLLEIARTLVGSTPATLFGNNEFKIRNIILGVAAKAYEEHLAKKKRLRRSQHNLLPLRLRRRLPR